MAYHRASVLSALVSATYHRVHKILVISWLADNCGLSRLILGHWSLLCKMCEDTDRSSVEISVFILLLQNYIAWSNHIMI